MTPPAGLAGARELAESAARLAGRLPEPLRPLAAVAYNYAWSWARDGRALFRDLEPRRWQASGQNPVRFLGDLALLGADPTASRPELRERIAALAEGQASYLAEPPRRADGLDGPVAFLCAEFGFHVSVQIYAGGLGVLAGDLLKEASDRGFPLLGIGLLYRRGYFHQRLDRTGLQHEYWLDLDPELLPMARLAGEDGAPLELSAGLFGRETAFHVWRVDVGRVPLYLLDSDLPGNNTVQRWTTARLYDGNPAVRLAQYGLLGKGAASLLAALGVEPGVLHLNEGHPALAPLELAARLVEAGAEPDEALEEARRRTVFTTHTPVPAGNETYAPEEFLAAFADLPPRLGLTPERFLALCRTDPEDEAEKPGMSPLAIRLSRARNGVSRLHGEVARAMWQPLFPGTALEDVPIGHVTNGAHLPTFVSEPFDRLLAAHLGGDWLARAVEPALWEGVRAIPNGELWAARCEARAELVAHAREQGRSDRLARGETVEYVRSLDGLDPEALTLGFARRLATYKRLSLLLQDPERALAILGGPSPVQLLIAGKAHPNDEAGKATLQQLFLLRREHEEVGARVVFLEDYDLEVARRLVAGCDVWVNLPRRPQEASGTSGMKATFNGALQLSVLDGWWAEAYDGTNGWAIPGDEEGDPEAVDERDADCFYDLLEREVVPAFYERDAAGVPQRWCELVKAALVTCAPRFTATRMLEDYVARVYRPEPSRVAARS